MNRAAAWRASTIPLLTMNVPLPYVDSTPIARSRWRARSKTRETLSVLRSPPSWIFYPLPFPTLYTSLLASCFLPSSPFTLHLFTSSLLSVPATTTPAGHGSVRLSSFPPCLLPLFLLPSSLLTPHPSPPQCLLPLASSFLPYPFPTPHP